MKMISNNKKGMEMVQVAILSCNRNRSWAAV